MTELTSRVELKKEREQVNWYLVYSKPREEQRALLNLERQGFECYLPMHSSEKLRRGELKTVEEPLFPRYLFIRSRHNESYPAWGSVRSTLGVSCLVTFGSEPVPVPTQLIKALKDQDAIQQSKPQRLFQTGDRVRITEGPFFGLEAIYQMSESASRAMVLIEILSKSSKLKVAIKGLRKMA